MAGTWMQMTAQSWLVLTLTHSSTDLGLAVALQALPVLFLGPYGGGISGRVGQRRPRAAGGVRLAPLLGNLRACGHPRAEQRVRELRPAVVRAGDGRQGRTAQRD